MTVTDALAAYAALLATALAVWDVAKYYADRPRLRVRCFVGELMEEGIGVTERNLLAYNIANTGGRPIVVSSLGGALRSGPHFLLISRTVKLPHTLQPGESIAIVAPMPEDVEDIRHFIVHDGLGQAWTASSEPVMRQLAKRKT